MTETKNLPQPQFRIPEWLAPHVAEVRGWRAVSTPQKHCVVTVCDRVPVSLGLCKQHYHGFARRFAIRESVSVAEWLGAHRAEAAGWPVIRRPDVSCWVVACDRSARKNGLCHAHYRLARHHFYRAESQTVAPQSDSVGTSSRPSEGTSDGGPDASTREPREVHGDPSECGS